MASGCLRFSVVFFFLLLFDGRQKANTSTWQAWTTRKRLARVREKKKRSTPTTVTFFGRGGAYVKSETIRRRNLCFWPINLNGDRFVAAVFYWRPKWVFFSRKRGYPGGERGARRHQSRQTLMSAHLGTVWVRFYYGRKSSYDYGATSRCLPDEENMIFSSVFNGVKKKLNYKILILQLM